MVDMVHVNAVDTTDLSYSELIQAVEWNALAEVRELLDHDKVVLSDADTSQALIRAISLDRVDMFRELLTHDNVNVNAIDHDGFTPLNWASLAWVT